MTQEQKILILHYREQHMTYRQIGEKLGLSPDTVKTFCRRNTPQEDRTEASASSQCRNCGAPVHPLPGRRERLPKVLQPRLLYPSSLWKHCVSVRGERKGNAFPSIGSRPDCSSDKQKADGLPSGGS